MRNAAGSMRTRAIPAMISIALRQSIRPISKAANGDIVIGAMPNPAETSETARLRWVSNQRVTVAIKGGRIAETETPTSAPKASWNWRRLVARLASASPTPSRTVPISTTVLGPMRSTSSPQARPEAAIVRKPIVIALETPVRDQPVAAVSGTRNTGRQNIAPIATQPRKPPAATITQRYGDCVIVGLRTRLVGRSRISRQPGAECASTLR